MSTIIPFPERRKEVKTAEAETDQFPTGQGARIIILPVIRIERHAPPPVRRPTTRSPSNGKDRGAR